MPKPHGRDLAKEWYWRRLLRQWRRSGLTGRAFCAEQELSEPSFYAWKREIARRDHESRKSSNKTAPATKAGSTIAALRTGSLAKQPRAASGPGFVKLAFPADDGIMPSP